MRTTLIPAAGLAVILAGAAHPQAVELPLVPSGATARIGGYAPQRLELSPTRPPEAKKLPDGLKAPLFGVLRVGPREMPASYVIVVDEPEGVDARLFVDTNRNGDLTDDPAVTWTSRVYDPQKGLKQYQGSLEVALGAGADAPRVRYFAYRFDPRDERRAALQKVLLYYGDFARVGKLTLGNRTFDAILVDMNASGDFRGTPGPRGSTARLMLDVNGNGKIDSRGENYDATQPFNIGGTTYELSGLTADGRFTVVKSARTVAEVLPPKEIRVGQPALAFTARTTDGKEIQFPSSYKGKLVLLDFWATWCGPCIAELPHLLAAYETHHPKGLEVLGISLDQANAAEKLAAFTKQHKMTWPQVYDGKFWEAEIAQLYDVNSIPRAYLVDGDTGMVVATGNDLRGPRLAETIRKALEAKKAAP